jgi:hypothetical protein
VLVVILSGVWTLAGGIGLEFRGFEGMKGFGGIWGNYFDIV